MSKQNAGKQTLKFIKADAVQQIERLIRRHTDTTREFIGSAWLGSDTERAVWSATNSRITGLQEAIQIIECL